ncbi:SIR2 family NAD-dependent protein deacylase [Streptomyces blattellae]|uniref:SIR2 family NAD-dependent protein deacylase n=1 Tax=Streptomyces blattellae TaxID=2569855 RepID=UPI0012B73627|nr:Sir2 family NAD-dependent protein deacetylase [Streptomyces blattellae]
MDEIKRLDALLASSGFTVAITGAGISSAAGIGVMGTLNMADAMKVRSTTVLRATPKSYYAAAWRAFLEPMFTTGPTLAHDALARLEQQGRVRGVVTTNLDCLHSLAGSRDVAEIQGSFGVNKCLKCERRYDDVQIWNQGRAPRCLDCGGAIAPFPSYSNIGLLREDVDRGNQWLSQAELVLVIGTNGPYGMAYFDHINRGAQIIQINPQSTQFDHIAALNIKQPADVVFGRLSI